MKKRIVLKFALIAAVCGMLILQSCEEDSVTPPVDNTTTVKPYISVNGQKFICKTQTKLNVTLDGRDSVLTWVGTGFSDTILYIRHQKNELKVGTYQIDSTLFGDKGLVVITIGWGNMATSPKLSLATGTYELKRENGKFVSYLKNGEAYINYDPTKRVKNIEFKVVWPY